MGTKVYPEFNTQKATEASALLMGMHGGRMSKVKLLKLLYLSDRKAFELWERPITYDVYYSMNNGQVLSGVLDIINNQIIEPIWKKHIKGAGHSLELIGENIKVKKMSRAEVGLQKRILLFRLEVYYSLTEYAWRAITKPQISLFQYK